ncbi:hypothetical protein AV530_017744 [Patagioenas fasciata monilis]|uniref:Peptidase S1 domain-containing protein n=1 Tax=Patagioenas fasciata monilis TaxID=372326 RepID=A0A1V4L187_PATFA|nr:hypothetical protein AV530_017744 [Patagioenas fasciata monilis]
MWDSSGKLHGDTAVCGDPVWQLCEGAQADAGTQGAWGHHLYHIPGDTSAPVRGARGDTRTPKGHMVTPWDPTAPGDMVPLPRVPKSKVTGSPAARPAAAPGHPDRAGTMMLGLLLLLVAGGSRAALVPNQRVVNGEDAAPYSWPWQISLQYERDGTFRHTCGGSLIAPHWVLTAAHCISSSRTYEVVLGEYDMSAGEGTEQRIPVASTDIFVHPKWQSSCLSCGNDIALLKLQHPAVLSAEVQVVQLPPPDTVLPDGYPCYLSGWGRLSSA